MFMTKNTFSLHATISVKKTTVYINGTVQFPFFLVIKFIVTTATSSYSLIVISSLKIENEMMERIQNVAEIKYGFVKFVGTFLILPYQSWINSYH